MTAYGETLLVGQAGLFDVDIQILDRFYHTHRFMREPTRIRIGDKFVTGGKHRSNRVDPFDIFIRVSTNLQLETLVTLISITSDIFSHDFGRLLGDGSIECHTVRANASQKRGDRLLGHFTQEIPARHVHSRLDVRMPLQRPVHPVPQRRDLTRVHAEDLWTKFRKACTNPFAIGR